MSKKLFYILPFVFFVFLLSECAQVGSPTGGPKDTIPPKDLAYLPGQYATGYDKTFFKGAVKYDEFIKLVKQNEEFYVSPVQKEKPVLKVKNKKLIIKLKDTLQDNTTYTLWFGSSVCDFRESNPIEDYMYVFSTSDHIDTLSIRGNVYNAFDHKKEENIWVMVYENYNDSTPIKELPDYVAETDTAGRFSIKYIREGRYRIFALKDANANYLFDTKSEPIAFLDTLIQPQVNMVTVMDTIVKTLPDSTISEEIQPRNKVIFTPDSVRLYLFEEERDFQSLTESKRKERMLLQFIFRQRLYEDSVTMNIVDTTISTKNWFIKETNSTYDTINYWLTDTLMAKKDTMSVELKYLVRDSVGNFAPRIDTIQMNYKAPKEKPTSRKKKKQEEEVEDPEQKRYELGVKVSPSGKLDLNSYLTITSPRPMKSVDASKLKLVKLDDTLRIPANYEFYRDTFSTRHCYIRSEWEEDTKYQLFIDTLAFVDYFEVGNDTIDIKFSTPTIDSYSEIKLTYTYTQLYPAILQILGSKDVVLREIPLIAKNEPTLLTIGYMKKGSYKLKLIEDRNRNGKWDTGNYLQNLQAERVLFYPSPLEIKDGWNSEMNWNIQFR